MDSKTIKAVRIVLGFNDDLRVKLKYVNKMVIFNFLDDYRYNIFGVSSPLANKPSHDSKDWEEWESSMWHQVNAVINGKIF